MQTIDLTDLQRRVLAKVPATEAYWTSDIAQDAGVSTSTARGALGSLERKGVVKKVAVGQQTSWQKTEGPRA